MFLKIIKKILELIILIFPKLNRQPLRSVSIPKLAGGINLRDSVTLIQDNQLTDCKNMWYKDNLLKTRMGLNTNSNMWIGTPLLNEYYSGRPTDIYMTKSGKVYRLFQYEASGLQHSEQQDGSDTLIGAGFYGLALVDDNEVIPLPDVGEIISFVTKYKDKLYVFTQERNIYAMTIDEYNDNPQWVRVEDNPELEEGERIYIPTIATNCKPDGSLAMQPSEVMASGTLIEGYNLLSSFYKLIFSTVNKSLLNSTNTTHSMIYGMLFNKTSEMIGKKVYAKITDKNGNAYTHSVTLTDNVVDMEQVSPGDGLYLRIDIQKICFCSNTSGSIAQISEDDYVENNLEIIAPCPNSGENLDKVFGMTQSLWFGGDALGISGGTRLFLGGNNNSEKEKSLILWSGLNNPLYFSENCYAYIGDSTQAVTAFGRQGDSLIIFKERELFYTQYTRNSGITAEDLINQNVVDYAASSVYFPIIQLHSSIGCDCPYTIQLCRNFLTWANSSGEVYTLRVRDQYSERNVYKVGDMIKRWLKGCGKEDLKNAHSGDFEGHYFIFVKDKVFVMNYESYGYVYVSSYNKTEDAQLQIPWWYWELPAESVSAFVSDNKLFCVFYHSDGYVGSGFCMAVFDTSLKADRINAMGEDNNEQPIHSMLTTKLFDFNSPHHFKNVPLINMAFGNNGGQPIYISFVTESGTEEGDTVYLTESNENEYSADYVHNRQLRPCVRLINRIAVKAECEGVMSLDSMSLSYKTVGGAK